MPVAVELNGLLPGLGPGRGAPGRGPDPPGLGAPGRGHQVPGSAARTACAPGPLWLGWSGRPAGAPGRCPPEPPGAPGRGAEGRVWLPGPSRGCGSRPGWPGSSAARAPSGRSGSPGDWSRLGEIGLRPGPGRRRRRDRRQRGRRIGGHRSRGGPVNGGAIGRGRAVRGAVGRPVGGGPGHGRNTRASRRPQRPRGHRGHFGAPPRAGARPRPGADPGAARGRAVPRRGRCRRPGLRPWADCCATLEANASLSRRTTGASIVEDADRTNSPISWSLTMTALLSTPNSFASS